MSIAKVTFKGQVTIPKEVRHELGIEDGDSLLFQVQNGIAMVKRVKRAELLDLYGAFPTKRAFHGKEEVRDEVRRRVARKVTGTHS